MDMMRTSRMSLLSTVLIVVQVQYVITDNLEIEYSVFADAGSSSTKVKVYTWPKPANENDIPNITLLTSSTVKPGIGSFVKDETGLVNHLKQIVSAAKEHVPEELQRQTHLFIMSTAGTRILKPTIARDFMDAIGTRLTNVTWNPFHFAPNHAQILSGEEEAVFGWIALNYLRDFFTEEKPPTQTIGILEMGGGSTQIAFIPEVPLYADEFHLAMGYRRYSLYAHSYLQYGGTYMGKRIKEEIIRRNPGVQRITDPCRLKDDTVEYRFGDRTVTLVGSGDPVKCSDIIRTFVSPAQDYMCYPKPCAIGQVYQPPVGNETFYAVGAFSFSPKVMKAISPPNRLNIRRMIENTHLYCRKTLSTVLAEEKIKPGYASHECLMGLYIGILLTEAYKFPNHTTSIIISNKIGTKKIEWTLGAILYEEITIIHPIDQPNVDCVREAASTQTLSFLVLGLLMLLIPVVTE